MAFRRLVTSTGVCKISFCRRFIHADNRPPTRLLNGGPRCCCMFMFPLQRYRQQQLLCSEVEQRVSHRCNLFRGCPDWARRSELRQQKSRWEHYQGGQR